MQEKITWKDCIEQNIITRIAPDSEKAQQMERLADLRYGFWQSMIDEKYIFFKVEAYYEIIKELIFANIFKEGYDCKNHICLIAYLREKFRYFEYETEKINELRKIRNEINYRGFQVENDYLKKNELEFRNIIRLLKERLINLDKAI